MKHSLAFLTLSFAFLALLTACGQQDSSNNGGMSSRFAQNPYGYQPTPFTNPFLNGSGNSGPTSTPDSIEYRNAVDDTFGAGTDMLRLLTELESNDGDMERFMYQLGPIFAALARIQDERVSQALVQLAKYISTELAKMAKNPTKPQKKSFISAIGKLLRGFIGSVVSLIQSKLR